MQKVCRGKFTNHYYTPKVPIKAIGKIKKKLAKQGFLNGSTSFTL